MPLAGAPRGMRIVEGRVRDRRHPRGRSGEEDTIGLREFGPPNQHFQETASVPSGVWTYVKRQEAASPCRLPSWRMTLPEGDIAFL